MSKSLILILTLLLSLSSLSAQAGDDDKAAPVVTPLYYVINEPFTINFYSQSQKKYQYLQVKVALMSMDQKVLDSAKQNLPMLQDALRALLMSQNLKTVSSVEGRKQIQKQALDKLNSILENETGQSDLKAVYFTTFILQ